MILHTIRIRPVLDRAPPGLAPRATTVYGSHMNFPRASPEACRFVELLHAAGQKFWQVRPTGYADSPFMSSVSNTAIAPMPDILGLGNEARMNLPGTSGGNWKRRMEPGAAAAEITTRLREMVTLYDR